MSRQIYTYTDLTQLRNCGNFKTLMEYPQITVSADLRKCLNGSAEHDKVNGIVSDIKEFHVTEFRSFAQAIDDDWNTDQCKFREMIILSEFMREKLAQTKEKTPEHNWLVGCTRNLDSILSSIVLLEQASVFPDDFDSTDDRNLSLFIEAWKYLIDKEPSINRFRDNMKQMSSSKSWEGVFERVWGITSVEEIKTIVFHGFYYITPYQERIMRLLEESGFSLVFLIPYDERYPYVYEIWDETYSEKRGFVPKSEWKIDKSTPLDPYGEIFEGKEAEINNNLTIKEYASIVEFVDDVKHIREKGISLYSADFKSANKLLKDYYPEAYGDRKILSYPIGLFVNTLNRMWDDDTQSIAIDEENLIECFSSGWLATDGVSGKEYMQDLMHIMPFFAGCHSIEDWEKRIDLLKTIKESVIAPFSNDLDPDVSVSRWQEALCNPLSNFSVFAVPPEKLDIILKLIKQLLEMARELFGTNELVHIHDHIRTLDLILRKHEISHELYEEERLVVSDIFNKLGADNRFDAMCHPSDIARALDLFICDRYEEGEIQTNRVGLIYPLYFVDAACVKNKSRVHVCFSDVETLPGGNKDYIWPLTGRKIKETFSNTNNTLLINLMQIMESNMLCNRFFTYCALKNKNVTLSWINTVGDKKLAPSPYIKLLLKLTGVKLRPAARNAITGNHVADAEMSHGRINPYDKTKAPLNIIKEARMDYALCPMKYVLGYVVEKYPTYQSDFQMNYALNALISAICGLMKEKGIGVDEAYEAVVELFPSMRKVERRQIYDYLSYDRKEDDMDYTHRTRCGDRYYTDERIKIHYPNQNVREKTIALYGKLNTPDGRMGLDLYEEVQVPDACVFCQHIDYCRNAKYAVDREYYYD